MLNNQQIELLFQYCEYKGVRYYDVQSELVDHIAGIIEKLQAEQPSASLRDLIWQVDSCFRPEEFKGILQSKSASVRKKYLVLFKKELLTYFTIPRVSFLILLYVLMFYGRNMISRNLILMCCNFLFFYAFIAFLSWKKRLKLAFGQNLYESKLPLLNLQLLKYFINRIYLIIGPAIIGISACSYVKDGAFAKLAFMALYPLLSVMTLVAYNLQYRVAFQIRNNYAAAFD